MAVDSVDKVIAAMHGWLASEGHSPSIHVCNWADRLRALRPVLSAEEMEALKAVESWLNRRQADDARYSEQAKATLCATIRRITKEQDNGR